MGHAFFGYLPLGLAPPLLRPRGGLGVYLSALGQRPAQHQHQHASTLFFSPSVDIGIGWILLELVGFCWILLDFVVVLPTTNIVGRWFLIDASDSLYSLYVTIDCGGRLVRSAKPWGNTTRLHRHTLMVVAANGLCSIGSL